MQKEGNKKTNRRIVANERHVRLLKRISDNLGKGMPIGKAMMLEGYSRSYSESPNQLLSTRSWRDIAQEYLPDQLLVEVHKDLLKNKDWRAKDAGLDKAYKIKGKYRIDLTHEDKRGNMTKEELVERILKRIFE